MNTASLLEEILRQEFGPEDDDIIHYWDENDGPNIAWCGADLTGHRQIEHDPEDDERLCVICREIDRGSL